MQIKILVTLFILLLGLLVLLIGVYFILFAGSKEKQVDRKWTDPKFHD